ncbi:exported hypothetical protein [Candidatus Sulfotelmatobacter kueseliae]|uniref:Uncharacterized protein n=1 Tax=Candidatus Sulfotelmatobacter kueseliae TaxID=2042962 RepID=A0A2U3KNS9_9BACT|nr:exported hypothetical protein [Candidatus Sulfotelmatobacter kueseliae]
MAMPKAYPNRQKKMPISSRLCPLMAKAPLRKLTLERSGSFRAASPPAGSLAGWAKAAAAPMVKSAAVATIFVAVRRKKAALDRIVRIKTPPKDDIARGISNRASQA